MKIKVKAFPKSGREEIIKINDLEYKVYIKSVPENNKANIELLKVLKKYFKKEVRIKSGYTSRNKVVEILD